MNDLEIGEIERRIYSIRGVRVILDADLAKIYGVSTKRLNEQFRRNRKRFPEDFAFSAHGQRRPRSKIAHCDLGRSSAKGRFDVVANCDHIATSTEDAPSLGF
jgi:hypothetical protein